MRFMFSIVPLPNSPIPHLLSVDGCMQVGGGVFRGVWGVGVLSVGVAVVGGVVGVVVAHMSWFLTHLQHMSKRCLQHAPEPVHRKKSQVQSAEMQMGTPYMMMSNVSDFLTPPPLSTLLSKFAIIGKNDMLLTGYFGLSSSRCCSFKKIGEVGVRNSNWPDPHPLLTPFGDTTPFAKHARRGI